MWCWDIQSSQTVTVRALHCWDEASSKAPEGAWKRSGGNHHNHFEEKKEIKNSQWWSHLITNKQQNSTPWSGCFENHVFDDLNFHFRLPVRLDFQYSERNWSSIKDKPFPAHRCVWPALIKRAWPLELDPSLNLSLVPYHVCDFGQVTYLLASRLSFSVKWR